MVPKPPPPQAAHPTLAVLLGDSYNHCAASKQRPACDFAPMLVKFCEGVPQTPAACTPSLLKEAFAGLADCGTGTYYAVASSAFYGQNSESVCAAAAFGMAEFFPFPEKEGTYWANECAFADRPEGPGEKWAFCDVLQDTACAAPLQALFDAVDTCAVPKPSDGRTWTPLAENCTLLSSDGSSAPVAEQCSQCKTDQCWPCCDGNNGDCNNGDGVSSAQLQGTLALGALVASRVW